MKSEEAGLILYGVVDPYKTCWHRRTRACSFWATKPTAFAGGFGLAYELYPTSADTGLYLQEGSVR